MASVVKNLDSKIAHMPGVKKEVAKAGRGAATRAKARLAEHRDTGSSRIETHREDTDFVISLVDDEGNALAIEAGRAGYTRSDGREIGPMEGLRILRNSLRGP